jgi:hypothetical protein
MAKKSKKGSVKLYGPLYTDEGQNLGGSKVDGPTGGKGFPDPLGFNKTSSK